jgi:diguanylate cyclase (GGDEF)-like protein
MSTTHTPQSVRLRALVDTVQRNERTLRRFQDVELQLIRAQDFPSLCRVLLDYLPREFGLERVTLWLNDTLPLLHELALRHASSGAKRADGNNGKAASSLKTSREMGDAAARLCSQGRPWLGTPAAMDDAARNACFGSEPRPASLALLPLATNGQPSGYLCLASDNESRFAPGMATDMLERFAVIVAASLDNVAHREQLERLGATDALTGLPNRRYFDERLREETTRASRYRLPLGCLFIDIDGFKPINDAYGHAVGDRALAMVGACLRKQTRLGDTIARYGGEEFAVLLQGDLKDSLVVAERMRAAVAQLDLRDNESPSDSPNDSAENGKRIPLTVSIGVSAHGMHQGADLDSLGRTLVDEADRAMYKAKSGGRNRVATLVG